MTASVPQFRVGDIVQDRGTGRVGKITSIVPVFIYYIDGETEAVPGESVNFYLGGELKLLSRPRPHTTAAARKARAK